MAGTACFILVAYDLLDDFPTAASMISQRNKFRVRKFSSLLVLWAMNMSLMHGFTLFGNLSQDTELMGLVINDIVIKLGGAHIVLEDREVLRNALRHMR